MNAISLILVAPVEFRKRGTASLLAQELNAQSMPQKSTTPLPASAMWRQIVCSVLKPLVV